MAVSLRGYTQGAFSAVGTHTVAWPAGTAVDDIAVWLVAPGKDKKPKSVMPAGWALKGVKSDGTALYAKKLVAADITAPLVIAARIQLGVVLAGAAGVGAVGSGESMSIPEAGAFVLFGWKATSTDLTSGKIHASDIVNESFLVGGKSRRYNAWLAPMASAGTAYIDTNASVFFGVRITTAAVLPPAPTLLAPALSFLDYISGGTITFKWLPSIGRVAISSRVRVRQVGTSTWLYVQAGGASLASTVYTQYGYPQVTVAHARFANNTSYEWQAAISEDGTNWSPYSAARTFSFRSWPTINGVTNTVTGLEVLVSWAQTITNAPQTWYRVWLVAPWPPGGNLIDNVPFYDSGVVSSADNFHVIPATTPWTNGGGYQVWVQFGQAGGQKTDRVSFSVFTMSWSAPAAPATVTAQHGQPMTLTVTGVAGRDLLRIQLQQAGEWVTVAEVAVTGDTMTVPVPLHPYGEAHWRVMVSDTLSGVQLWSPPYDLLTVGADRNAYLVALDGASYVHVHPAEVAEPEDTEGILVSYGLGGTAPTVNRTPSQGARGTDTVVVASQAKKDELLAWLAANPTFIYRYPPERDRTTWADVPHRRMARTTPLKEARLQQKDVQRRTVTWSWVEQ